MNDEEKYRFDLQGFLVVENVLSPELLDSLNALTDAKFSEIPAEKTNHRFGGPLDWGEPFRQAICLPNLMPYVETIVGRTVRLDHDYLDIIRPRAGLGPIGATLHGGGEPLDLGQSYRFQNGKMHNGLIVAAIALKDVHPGDGGFACVPGSHKANLPLPESWRDMAKGFAPGVTPIPCRAGSVVLFTEALTHGTAPWLGAGERRTLFLKYSPHFLAWAVSRYDPDRYPDLPLEARKLLEGPNYRYRGRIGAVE